MVVHAGAWAACGGGNEHMHIMRMRKITEITTVAIKNVQM